MQKLPKPLVSSNSPPEPVFFIDRDLGAYKLPSFLKAGGLAVEVHKDHFPPDALDAEWLPVVAAKRWVIVTHDKGISRNPMEIAACLDSAARVLFSEVRQRLMSRPRTSLKCRSGLSICSQPIQELSSRGCTSSRIPRRRRYGTAFRFTCRRVASLRGNVTAAGNWPPKTEAPSEPTLSRYTRAHRAGRDPALRAPDPH